MGSRSQLEIDSVPKTGAHLSCLRTRINDRDLIQLAVLVRAVTTKDDLWSGQKSKVFPL